MKTRLFLMSIIAAPVLHAQNTVDFEAFALPPDTFYMNKSSKSFSTQAYTFRHRYDTSFGGYWDYGFSYTNHYDSSTTGSTNQHGVRAYKGMGNSTKYAVAQIGTRPPVVKINGSNAGVSGFYVTNTTYAWKSMMKGDAFAKKFGGASGSDPDYFKLAIFGYRNGSKLNDSIIFYLADFRFSDNSKDYIVNTWEFVNTTGLGNVDSVSFYLRSSDNGQFGMNTPAFFAIDDFGASPLTTNFERRELTGCAVFPSEFQETLNIIAQNETYLRVVNSVGTIVLERNVSAGNTNIDVGHLSTGVYLTILRSGDKSASAKIIKE
jgi:hypothetical protein